MDKIQGKEFTVERTFAAPRALVWKAWTDPKALAKWWGPKGASIKVAKLEVKPGGIFHYSMGMGPQEIWGKFVYREVAPPERLTFISQFSDAEGRTTRNPWLPTWPAEVLNVLTLREQAGKTALTLRGGPINASEAERSVFEENFANMEGGFNGTFDALDEFLANQ